MRVVAHLMFDGHCEEAFRFYERCLGGTDLRLFRGGDDKIVHASLTVGDTTLAGADVTAAQYEAPRGFHVLIHVKDPNEAERVFALLSDGGRIVMPLERTFWSPAFGVLVDRYGVPWEISCDAPAAT